MNEQQITRYTTAMTYMFAGHSVKVNHLKGEYLWVSTPMALSNVRYLAVQSGWKELPASGVNAIEMQHQGYSGAKLMIQCDDDKTGHVLVTICDRARRA